MRRLCLLSIPLSLIGCGSDDKPCDVASQSGCDNGELCEEVSGAEPVCLAPIELRGRVIDLADARGIAGARVVAVDINGAAASSVAISGSDGSYVLPIPAVRNPDHTPSALAVSLRADAAGYLSFPGTVRQALPVDIATAIADGDGFVIDSALTEIGLIATPDAPTGSIRGKVDAPGDHAGVLVVAEAGADGFAAIASRDGDYQIFNLGAGHYNVTAYAIGHVYTAGEIDVADTGVTLNLALSSAAPGSLTGQVSIVDGGGASTTSVVAFVESTFDPVTGRGIAPPGLRSPRSGPPDVTGAFAMDGVPPGRYVVVAAFENDNLVRDPDHCIAGTEDVHVQVAAGQATAAPNTFKLTGALAMGSPGADAAAAVTAAPTFEWADDSSEDHYLVEVFDAFGQRTWMSTMPGVSGSSPSMTYTGPPLQAAMYYQWRVTSLKSNPRGGAECELSRSEDLRGVFFTQ
jgi:hypothetical protein